MDNGKNDAIEGKKAANPEDPQPSFGLGGAV
jgi:hypothetical protein